MISDPVVKSITSYLQQTDGIVILAGAGMGVDAGIPDFRGKNGIWTAEKDAFIKYATASSFHTNPLDAWNFYINRFLMYRELEPHKGYYDLLGLEKDIFVVTSNVDGHFIKSGYDRDKLYEIHGNLEYIQCSMRCCRETQPMPEFNSLLTHIDEIPVCPKCWEVSRPQVMMFNDPWFVTDNVNDQSMKYIDWQKDKKRILGIEIGAGLTVPSIRMFGEERTDRLIRINPNDYQVSRQNDISIPLGALEGIELVIKLFKGD
jgi:NAD-dependent SIR2 family protein deacetylase